MNAYQMAYNAACIDNYTSNIHLIPAKSFNPEQQYIKKESFQKLLSNDAQTAIGIIFNPPIEIKESLSYRGLTWKKVAEYLIQNHGWKWRKTLRIRKEIKNFLKEN